jgi:hypothetical protein
MFVAVDENGIFRILGIFLLCYVGFYGYPEGLGWPPRKASDFLGLQTLDSVPDAYRRFAG